ncbi:MAG TPA: methyltransferase domain-containing protein [Paucimonas sp.]|nr:methyltransferase domain-containing protein [Paucimonas sp.]HJW55933.1 methyltransferase domain-containing protein [Burkholderiaceae bacterium]
MQSTVIPGTEGYIEDAELLIPRYESVSFLDKYKAVAHLFPKKQSKILDIGAGTGVDAAWLAAKGHCVLAVEPTSPFRHAAASLHPSNRIEWLDDSLPHLHKTRTRRESFDLVLVTAVWMHLSAQERQQAMSNIANLLKPSAFLVISLRHGLAPSNRRVFDVSAEETIELAQKNGLLKKLYQRTESVQSINRQAEVTWSWIAFQNQLQAW